MEFLSQWRSLRRVSVRKCIVKCKSLIIHHSHWFKDEKHGFGRYYFAKQIRLFQGIWLNDMCKSAEQQQQQDETSASQKNLTMNDISNDHGLVIGTDDDDATASAVTEKEKKRRQAYARAAN